MCVGLFLNWDNLITKFRQTDDCVNSFFFNSKLSTKSGRRADNEKQTPNRLEGGGVSG